MIFAVISEVSTQDRDFGPACVREVNNDTVAR